MAQLKLKNSNFKWMQPLDRVAITVIAILSAIVMVLLLQGDHSSPRVRDFSWNGKQISAADDRFILTFSRPMDRASVEANLQINPPLPGKFSWAGRKLAYTLLSPAPYGVEYQVQLQAARDKFSRSENSSDSKAGVIKPFTAKFRTRDRAFAYIGVEGEQAGRLMLVNLDAQSPKPIALTPEDLVVSDFKPFPDSRRILFAANDRTNQLKGVVEQNLYTVTTGINPNSPEEENQKPEPAGKVRLVLDNKDYQNLKFDLSADGKTIVVQRLNRQKVGEFGLWVVKIDGDRFTAKPLENQGGGDFLITPDSKAIAVAQGEGLAIVPLTLEAPQDKPLDFLPKFGMVASFSHDGTEAAMVKFNTDYTRSLYLVTNQGVEKELLRISGSIIEAEFDSTGQTLYCLLTKLLRGEQYQEQPYIASIDIKTAKMKPLLVLPDRRQLKMSLSPDGIAILFDQPVVAPIPAGFQSDAPRTDSQEAVTSGSLWLLPLVSNAPAEGTNSQTQPEQLPLPGFHPVWLP